MELLLRSEETMDIIRNKDEYSAKWFMDYFCFEVVKLASPEVFEGWK
jgi:hypothetical protein